MLLNKIKRIQRFGYRFNCFFDLGFHFDCASGWLSCCVDFQVGCSSNHLTTTESLIIRTPERPIALSRAVI